MWFHSDARLGNALHWPPQQQLICEWLHILSYSTLKCRFFFRGAVWLRGNGWGAANPPWGTKWGKDNIPAAKSLLVLFSMQITQLLLETIREALVKRHSPLHNCNFRRFRKLFNHYLKKKKKKNPATTKQQSAATWQAFHFGSGGCICHQLRCDDWSN